MVDPFWPKPLPNNWIMGQAAGVAVSLREAARKVGVDPAACYRHFRDKTEGRPDALPIRRRLIRQFAVDIQLDRERTSPRGWRTHSI